MKPESQAQILAKQLAYHAASRELDAALKRQAPPEEVKRLRTLYEQREAEYEAAIDAAAPDTQLLA